ncbi:glycosyltransferase family 4 protein [Methylobacillus gramineus]|uniref:glycosyltransferase family 4 protein n=1 Tax=Methylobacillus gramineus TaxID=755169 RepID=UPI001CFF6C29|nr:glycosyltransferase family 4 protein [Methylobacillus gramineus]MCB5183695.1 glycosyltransferase family 4 protein [Methylobacillus gramineus]
MNKSGRKVLVIQRRMTHYRIPFFEALRAEFAKRNCELVLAAGTGTPEESTKNDSGNIPWAKVLPTHYFANGRICWQSFNSLLGDVDCAVFALENKLLFNLYAQFLSPVPRVVLWGHGANLQGDPKSLREKFKRYTAKKADWWLGYTPLSRPLIEKSGFPSERISILNNSIDTTELKNLRDALNPDELQAIKDRLSLNGKKVGIYVGSLYKEKRIQFMLEAAKRIRQDIPEFEFLIVGAGPDSVLVEEFVRSNPWVHYLGAQKGKDKVALLAISDVMLNPGLVGLGILDSFVCEVPLLTTDCGLHSPEIAYLENHSNGLITEDTLENYAQSVIDLLADEHALLRLKAGCAASAKKFTVENMAINFADAIVACMDAPPYRK